MQETSALLQPVMALVLWSLVMWAWMYATRIPAIVKARMVLDPMLPNGQQMATLPPQVRWKADNYNHLMEQPTIFYATALALAISGDTSGVNLALAWGYVGVRIVHSLVQALINKIEVRFGLFVLSSLLLLAMAINAALRLF